MIPFANIDKLIQDANATHVRICNSRGDKIIDVNGASPEDLISRLHSYGPTLAGYGSLKLKIGTDKDDKNSYTNAAQWVVSFPHQGVGSHQQQVIQQQPVHNQVMNDQLLAARVENERLKVSAEFSSKLLALEKKIEKGADGFMKYLPAIALFMDIPKDRMERMLQLGQVQSYLNGTGAPAAVSTPKTSPTGEVAANDWNEDNVKKIESGMQVISEMGTITAEEFLFLQEEMKKDPEGTKQMIAMLKMRNQAKA